MSRKPCRSITTTPIRSITAPPKERALKFRASWPSESRDAKFLRFVCLHVPNARPATGGDEAIVRIRPPKPWEALDLPACGGFGISFLRWRCATSSCAIGRPRSASSGSCFSRCWRREFSPLFSVVSRGSIPAACPTCSSTYAGLLAWNLFSSCVLKASGSLVANASLVAKVFFPRVLLPLSAVVSTLLDFFIGLGVGFILIIAYGLTPGVSLLSAPVLAGPPLIARHGRRPDLRRARGCLSGCHPHRSGASSASALRQPRGLHRLCDPGGASPDVCISSIPSRPLLEGFRSRSSRARLCGNSLRPLRQHGGDSVFIAGLIIFRRMERQFADVI